MARVINLDCIIRDAADAKRARMRPKCNWFNTLNGALDAEGLVALWPLGKNIGYGETVGLSSGGKWISVYRETDGRYERPIHYDTKMEACAL